VEGCDGDIDSLAHMDIKNLDEVTPFITKHGSEHSDTVLTED
jgi:gamma-glutamyl phosphate reductase